MWKCYKLYQYVVTEDDLRRLPIGRLVDIEDTVGVLLSPIADELGSILFLHKPTFMYRIIYNAVHLGYVLPNDFIAGTDRWIENYSDRCSDEEVDRLIYVVENYKEKYNEDNNK